MQIFKDIFSFLKTLSFENIVFFFVVVVLMLLVVTLIHFILENSDNEDNALNKKFDNINNNLVTEIKKDDKITKEANDLIEIAKSLENAEPNNSNLNGYEQEQEERAIISYDELLEKTNDWTLNYSEEKSIEDDLTIKKVDLNNLVNKEITIKPDIKVEVISYEKEEAFLAALKELQKLIN